VRYEFVPRVEACSNTFTIALRVVEATKREPSAWGYNWDTLFLEDIIWGPGPPDWGSLKSETVKYGQQSHGSQTKNDYAGEDQQQL
jgi:hypothetical protein